MERNKMERNLGMSEVLLRAQKLNERKQVELQVLWQTCVSNPKGNEAAIIPHKIKAIIAASLVWQYTCRYLLERGLITFFCGMEWSRKYTIERGAATQLNISLIELSKKRLGCCNDATNSQSRAVYIFPCRRYEVYRTQKATIIVAWMINKHDW